MKFSLAVKVMSSIVAAATDTRMTADKEKCF
jgi:hypothetical protein